MTSLRELLEALSRYRLLDAGQVTTLTQQWTRSRLDAQGGVKELVQRGWLTAFQANQLLRGRGSGLLLGSYVLLELVGEGGMGAVYKARNWKLGRIVAVKLIKPERLSNAAAARRFEREIRASAQLDHPNIVRALDADHVGSTHLLVMEYVPGGQDLHKLIRTAGPLPYDQACRFVLQAALGLQHAFERGLVHRDIKPHNLLRSAVAAPVAATPTTASSPERHPTDGIIKILDFGLARLGEADSDSSTLTREGSVMGTLDYLAPEQARDAHTADIRSDLYSLGCTLYFLLTGQPPFPGGAPAEKLYKHQFVNPASLAQQLPETPPALAAVLDRLLAKRPEDRYQTPAELALDLRALLAGRPISVVGSKTSASEVGATLDAQETHSPFAGLQAATAADEAPTARPTSAPAVPLKHARSRRPQVLLLAGSAAVVVILLVVLAIFMNRPTPATPLSRSKVALPKQPATKSITDLVEQEEREQQAFAAAEQQRLAEAEAALQKWFAEENAERARRDQEAELPFTKLEQHFKQKGVTFPQFAKELADFNTQHGGTAAARRAAALLATLPSSLDQLTAAALPEDAKVAWRASGFDGQDVVAVLGSHHARHWGPVTALALSPDRKWLASTTGTGSVTLWQFPTLAPVRTWQSHPAALLGLAFSPDGRRLATAGGGAGDDMVKFWDVETGALLAKAGEAGQGFAALAWSQADNFVAAARGNEIWILNPADANVLERLTQPAGNLSIAPRGGRFVSAAGTEITVWDWRNGKANRERMIDAKDVVWSVVMLADHSVAVAHQSGKHSIYRLEAETREEVLGPHGAHKVYASPSGKYLAVGDTLRRLTTWEITGAGAKRQRDFAKTGAAHPRWPATFVDDRTLLAGGGGILKIWDLDTETELTPARDAFGSLHSIAFSLDGSQLAAGVAEGFIQLWDLSKHGKPRTLAGHSAPVDSLCFAASGKQILSAGRDHTVRLWDAETGHELSAIKHGDGLHSVALTPNGRLALVGGQAGNVPPLHLWELDPLRKLRPWHGHHNHVVAVAFSPDGRLAVSASQDDTVRVWNVETGKEVRRWQARVPTTIQFAPDGATIYGAREDETISAWRLLSPAAEPALVLGKEGQLGRIYTLAVSPLEKLFVTAGAAGRVSLWNSEGALLKDWTLPGPVHGLAFAADGRHVATANGNGTVYIFRIPRQFASSDFTTK